METNSRQIDVGDVGRAGEDFIASLAGAFLALEVKEKKYNIQTKKVRKDQVKNSARGWVFPVSDEMRVRRFLILGTHSPTYYASTEKLTVQNLQALVDIINDGKAAIILKQIYEVSLAGRNPKQEPVMMALALCARYRVHDMAHFGPKSSESVKRYMTYLQAMHKAAIGIVNEVCRIPTHLFMFVKYCEEVATWTNSNEDKKSTGWGRLMRACIDNWYAAKSPDQLALHLTKYRQRDGWTHRDLFRLGHPRPTKNAHFEDHRLEIEQLYTYAAKGTLNKRKLKLSPEESELEEPEKKYTKVQMDNEKKSSGLDLVEVFHYINGYTPIADIEYAIHHYKLVREHIPTEHLNSAVVWKALLCDMPMTALVRNLGKVTAVGALDKVYEDVVVSQLTNEQQIKKSRIHPVQILMAKSVYHSGRGEKGDNAWTVNPRVDRALEDAFYLSFSNAPPTGKRICFAFDVSGSMSARIAGSHLSCRTASAALSLISLRNETNYKCVGFSHELIELPYDGSWTICKIEKHMGQQRFGNTDCALPMIWAKRRSLKFDVFVVFTDCETYFGKVHPFKALQNYRETSGIEDAKLIVMGMTATKFTIADPLDGGMLDIVGLDSSVTQIMYDFIMGNM